MILVRFFGFEVPTQTRGYNDRNFISTALAPGLPSKEGAARSGPGAILDTSRDTGTRHFTATLCRVGCRPCARYAAHDRRRNAGDERSLDESSFASLDDLLCIARGCAMREFRGADQDRRGAAVLGRRRVVRPAGQARA